MRVVSLTFLEDEISEQTSCSFVSYNLSENQEVNVSAGSHRLCVLCILISCAFLSQSLSAVKRHSLTRVEDYSYLWTFRLWK